MFGAIISRALAGAMVIALATVLSVIVTSVVPDEVLTVLYWSVEKITVFNVFIPMDAFFQCMIWLNNYIFIVASFFFIKWVVTVE